MPQGRKKSRSLKRKQVRTPGGENKTHYEKKKVSDSVCSNCGDNLQGVESHRSDKMNGLSKTEKVPERPYGGELCSSCTRDKIKEKARSDSNV